MNDLQHFGILGMKWGVRKSNSSGQISKSTQKLAEKDAKRFAEAKMFYGKTAGTKRKLLKAELDKKKKTIPDYEDAFDKALSKTDFSKAAKKAVSKRVSIDAIDNGRRLIKTVLGVTGPLTVAAAGLLYSANKDRIDAFVLEQFRKIMP